MVTSGLILTCDKLSSLQRLFSLKRFSPLFNQSKCESGRSGTSRSCAAPAAGATSELRSTWAPGALKHDIIFPKETTTASFQCTQLALEHSNSQKSSSTDVRDFLFISPKEFFLLYPQSLPLLPFHSKNVWEKMPTYMPTSKMVPLP